MTTQDEKAGTQPEEAEAKAVRWGRLAKAAVISAVPAAAAMLYFVGSESHEVQLAVLGVDYGPFKKSTEWLLIRGFHVTKVQLAEISPHLLNWAVLVAVAVLAALVHVSTWAGKAIDRKIPKTPPAWVRHPLVNLGMTTWLSTAVYLILPMFVILMVLLMMAGTAFGKTAGRDLALRQLAMYKKGCDAATLLHTCFEIRKGDEKIAKGFILDSSESHVAFFDVDMQASRVLERAGTEVVGLVRQGDVAAASVARQDSPGGGNP